MKLLTATSISQGDFPGDFSHATDGELVRLDEVCARDAKDPGGGCGCGRAFAGLTSRRATTSALVREVDLSDDQLVRQVGTALDRAGYTRALFGSREFDALVEETVDDMLDSARIWEIGTVVGRRLDHVHRRSPLPEGMPPADLLRRLNGRR